MPGGYRPVAYFTVAERVAQSVVYRAGFGAHVGQMICVGIAAAVLGGHVHGLYKLAAGLCNPGTSVLTYAYYLYFLAIIGFCAVGGLVFLRSAFTSHILRLDQDAQKLTYETFFLGRLRATSTVARDDVSHLTLAEDKHRTYSLQLHFKDGRIWTLDRSSDSEPLQALATDVAVAFGLPTPTDAAPRE